MRSISASAIASSAASLVAASSVASTREARLAAAQVSATDVGWWWPSRLQVTRARSSPGGPLPRWPAAAARARRPTSARAPGAARPRSSCRSPCRPPAPSCATSTASPASNSPDHLDDPDRQQAGAALAQRPRRAGVDEHPAAGRLGVLEPQLEARVAACRGPGTGCRPARRRPRRGSSPGVRPLAITVGIPAAVAISAATTFERIPPEPSGEVRVADVEPLERLELARPRGPARAPGRARGSAVNTPVGVGQQQQQLGAEQDRHLGGEEVVVAERDLVGGGGVVLVDHRHHPPVEQLAQRLAGVQVVGARAHVEERQQHLGGRRPRAPAAARRRPGRACPGRRRWPPAARRSRAGAAAISITPHAARDRAAGDDDRRAARRGAARPAGRRSRSSTSARTSPRSSATMLEPSLTTRQLIAGEVRLHAAGRGASPQRRAAPRSGSRRVVPASLAPGVRLCLLRRAPRVRAARPRTGWASSSGRLGSGCIDHLRCGAGSARSDMARRPGASCTCESHSTSLQERRGCCSGRRRCRCRSG